jgi:hypothetical protein
MWLFIIKITKIPPNQGSDKKVMDQGDEKPIRDCWGALLFTIKSLRNLSATSTMAK